MHALISLQFGTLIGGLKENKSFKFGINLFNIQRVINNFMHKTKSSFCQAYRVTSSRNKLKIGM